MKILIKIFPVIICLLLLSSYVCAEEEDWFSDIKNYESNKFEKIISTPEFNQAIKTREKYATKNKKNKKNKDKDKVNITQENIVPVQVIETDPLLTLPEDVCYENIVIKKGFYQIGLKRNEEKYFLILKQEKDKPIAIIEAKTQIDLDKKATIKAQASAEYVNNDLIKITYSENDLILESLLWRY